MMGRVLYGSRGTGDRCSLPESSPTFFGNRTSVLSPGNGIAPVI